MSTGSLPEVYGRFLDHHRETSLLGSCAGLLGWDQETYMPKGGAEIRSRQLALLRGMAHRRTTGKEYGDLLAAAEAAGIDAERHPEAAANLRDARRVYDRAVNVPAELVEEHTKTTVLARRAWVDARERNEFPLFLPHLEAVFDIARRLAEAIGYEASPYDAALDGYEPGETEEGIRELFEPLREAHVRLLGRILDSGRPVDTAVLHRHYPREAQARLARTAAEAIGFDFERGRIDETAHPLCAGTGPDDVRLTTRYHEDFFNPAFFGTLHEAGHGLYEQGLDMAHYGTPMGLACSFGVHESQSRMWENLVGRSRAFWRWCYPKARGAFPEVLAGVGEEDFWRAVNDVRPSLIRVEADEVTYNLHIMLRFELERAMLAGDLAPRDLPGAWNEAFERSFGITPPDDADGCLQDIHWSAGLIGYFPTYTLGNVYAAQIYAAAERDLGDLGPEFERGEFQRLKSWLTSNIHRHGRRFPARDLVERVCGEPPGPEPLIRQLESRFGAIYGL